MTIFQKVLNNNTVICGEILDVLRSVVFCAVMVVLTGCASPETLQAGQRFTFDETTLPQWEQRDFKGKTRYELVDLDGESVLQATADNTASLLYRQQDIDLLATPLVRWRWRIRNTYPSPEDTANGERSRNGDDYPARFYVAIQTGLMPWETITINYVWSSSEPVGAAWDNAFTDKARMLVLQSGESKKMQWITETRDLVADFRQLFGIEASQINGFAVMVDGDNSSQDGQAWFADIEFLPRP